MRRAWIALFALAVATPAYASFPDLVGIGPRSAAMAGLGAADADDYEAAYLNPAGLAAARRRRITVGYFGGRYQLKMDAMPRNVTDTDGILIGASLPLPFGGVMTNRLALGVAFYFPLGLINRAKGEFPSVPRLALLDNRTQTVSIMIGLGAQVHERVRVGIGVLALAALVGHIDIATDASGSATTVSQQQLVTNFAPVVGIQVKAASFAQVGVTLRGESRSDFDISIKPDLGDSLPIALPTLRVAGTSQYDPLQMAMEAAFDATKLVRISVGVTWKHWSTYTYPIKNATDGAPPLPAVDFHDTAVPRLGFELGGAVPRAPKLTVVGRAGYAFEWSPAPTNAYADGTQRTLLDADRHIVSAGLGLGYRGRVVGGRLDAFGQLHALTGSPRATGLFATFGVALGIDL